SKIELLENQDAMVVPYTGSIKVNAESVGAIRNVLLSSGQLAPENLLIKNPFTTTGYVQATSAQDALATFAADKYHHFANVIRLLGAREVHLEEAKGVDQTLEVQGKAKGNKVATAELDASIGIRKKITARLQAEMAFPGADAAPEEALAYMQKHLLSGDPQMEALVEMRRPPNQIQKYKLSFNCLRESATNVKAAASVAALVGLGLNFNFDTHALNDIEIVTEITF
ncbi:MAG: hypothetical protein AAB357_04365, partial [Actinomycetota bacterium]